MRRRRRQSPAIFDFGLPILDYRNKNWTCSSKKLLQNLKSKIASLDHPVRPCQHVGRNREADLLRGFQIDHQLELRRLLDRKVGGLGRSEEHTSELQSLAYL